MDDVTRVGFLGLGQMGAPMAERLFGPDVELHVFDPRPEAVAPFVARGAVACGSPREVADAASIVLACLPSGEVSEVAALGPEGVVHGRAIRVYAEMSTIGRPAVERIAAGLAARGIAAVDTPITGGPPGARAGTLALMVAGAADAVATLRPFLERIGKRLFVLGERPGQGQVMKLVNNLLIAANMVSAFEALAMGAKAGLDPDAMVDVVNAGTGRSFVTSDMMPAVLSRRFGFGAAIAVVDKDVHLGLEEARALGVPMWGVEQAARVWRFAATQGMAKDDISELARLMERWAGAEIRGREDG
jgi:3-hydroxyisobutyrate dehydrogenase-like beta-hydroxyacid dehydrogenase